MKRWGGRASTRFRLAVCSRDGWVCYVPGCVRWGGTVDHIVPLALGGAPFDMANGRAACGFHNSSAGAVLGNRQRAAARVAALPSREW